jgi:hypothetical protein
LTEEQFIILVEDDDVTFTLTRADKGQSEAYLIYNDDTEQPFNISLTDLRKV